MMQANQNSSRAAALARRKAMSSGGKSALSNNTDRTRSAPERAQVAQVSQPEAAPAAPTARPASSSAASYRPRVVASTTANPTRAAALARRKAMSGKGKSAAMSKDRTRDQSMVASSTNTVAAEAAKTEAKGDCGCGCKDKGEKGSVQDAPTSSRPAAKPRNMRNQRPKIAANPSKAAALARRKAQSTRGKAGISAGGMSEAQTARAANPSLTSRELSQALRQQRSSKGKTACKGGKCRPTGKVRKKPEAGAAEDQSWKVGISETARGQSVTGTMVGRDQDVTGNEASTCRSVTGTEYMGADVFREFCDAEPAKTPLRTGVSATDRGNAVTGNEVGRSTRVTGDEPGTCKNVTGTEYVAAGQSEAFCGTPTKTLPTVMPTGETRKGKTITGDNVGNSDKVTGGEAGANRDLTGAQYVRGEQVRDIPAKVRMSKTLHGGSVTGTAVGRSEKTTGDEAGSGRQITGDDYVGLEQYESSGTQVQPGDRKVGLSQTFGGQSVSGTMDARSERVTGNEPGTCKAVTGTPYFGMENYSVCETPAAQGAAARMQRNTSVMGKNMTGQQPGIGGVMTGAEKGACEPVTGTPYVGADQAADACPATPAQRGNSDFPQAVGELTGWGEFSVTPPAHAAAEDDNTGVTGSRYEQGQITGPFGMAEGKITGTEDARFGSSSVNSSSANEVVEEPQETEGRVKSRITGEGQDSGLKITGDDWDRGDRVTGTEGASALVRNPSLKGPMNAMVNKSINEVENEAPHPASKVTGSSGNYEGGSLITYSGGARG